MSHPTRVVVDTNVLVSGLLRDTSIPGQAAAKARRSHLLVSQTTMQELAEVLAKEKFDRYVTVQQRLQFIRLLATVAEFIPIVHQIRECRDASDDKFLEVAINGRADVIVTGDEDLLEMNPWREIAIITPADYLKR